MGYWCETCDRGFPSLHVLQNHKREHQKCKIDGCQFFAHPNVIIKHIQMQHASGLFNKIANFNKPEDIQRWIDDRKKKYPTKANIEKKIASVKEKINRGEKLGLSSYKKKEHKFKQGNDTRIHPTEKIKQSISKNNSKNQSKNNNRSKNKKKELLLPTVKEKHSLKPFTGLKNVVDYNDENFLEPEVGILDIEFDDDVHLNQTNDESKALLCTALSALSNNYGSSDEEKEMEIPTSGNRPILIEAQSLHGSYKNVEKTNKSKDKEDNSDDDGPEEVKVIKNNDANIAKTDKNIKHNQITKRNDMLKSQRHNNIKALRNRKSKLPSTLLQKLLQNEIRQERNIVLQGIRYIRNMNYFDRDKNT